MTDARRGMKATELRTFAAEILVIGRNDESQAIPSSAKATRPFQYLEFSGLSVIHSGVKSTKPAPTDRITVSAYRPTEPSPLGLRSTIRQAPTDRDLQGGDPMSTTRVPTSRPRKTTSRSP